jgi:septal ring factor EnvC (AmiA/AmiB activator)
MHPKPNHLFFNRNTCLRVVFLAFIISVFSGFNLAAQATEATDYQHKLDRLQKSIKKVHEHLKNSRDRKSHLLTELKTLESNISTNSRALKTTEKKIKELNRRVKQLKNDLATLSRQLRSQKAVLADQVRAAYALGSQQHLKMMLNQQDTSETGRIQVYFDYLNRAREREITSFLQTIEIKQKTENELASALSSQNKALTKGRKQKRTLQKQRLKRNQLLAQLEIKIKNQEQTLTDLESSRSKIEDLLMSLGQLLADIPASPGDQQPFKQQKGRLPWPIQGPFLARYGQPRNRGDLKWKGVLIGASYGDPIRTISHGRVAFADWLQGFGFITIVDHGEGFMSLYGHSESLFKQAGDWVTAGEVIATVGDSGGQPTPGLYFEIRTRGKTIDPNAWCSRAVQHSALR